MVTHSLSRTIFQVPWDDHFSANVVRAFHKPNLSVFVWPVNVKYGLGNGEVSFENIHVLF